MSNAVGDYVLDFGLNVLDTLADEIHIVSGDPANYAGLAAVSLGKKAFAPGAACGSPAPASPNGRKVSTTAITDGAVSVSGEATGWAVVDTVNTRLLANGQLSNPQEVTLGNTFSLPSIDITLPGQ